MEGTVGRRGCKPWVAIGGELPAMLDMDFREAPLGELLRIPLPRTWVNKEVSPLLLGCLLRIAHSRLAGPSAEHK
jgi:hypothetical protein